MWKAQGNFELRRKGGHRLSFLAPRTPSLVLRRVQSPCFGLGIHHNLNHGRAFCYLLYKTSPTTGAGLPTWQRAHIQTSHWMPLQGVMRSRQSLLRGECSKLRPGEWTYSLVLGVAHVTCHLIFSVFASRVLRCVVLERPSYSACTANEPCSTFRAQNRKSAGTLQPEGPFCA